MASQPPPPAGEGLGQSTPLVTLTTGAPPGSVVRSSPVAVPQSLTPASGNHPLAPPPPPPRSGQSPFQQQPLPPPPPGTTPVPPATYVQSSVDHAAPQHLPPPPVATPTMVAMPPPSAVPSVTGRLSPPRPTYTSTVPPVVSAGAPSNQLSATTSRAISSAPIPQPQSSSVQSLDELVDSFLSGPSYRTQNSMLPPLLRPPPLVHEDPLQCLRTLVERRAWGDVLQVTSDILNGTHAKCYDLLVQEDAGTTTSNATESEDDARMHAETTEVMALQCHAWLKLRRYADLGREIERWNFIAFNDCHTSEKPPAWVPWSLHILAAETLLYTTDDPSRGTDELFALQSRIPESDARWTLCADRALVNAFSRKRDWRMAMVLLDRMYLKLEDAIQQELQQSSSTAETSTDDTALLHAAYRTELLSVQGRVLLQAGAVAEAAILFQEAQIDWKQAESNNVTASKSVKDHVAVRHSPAQLLVNEGLMCFAYSNFDQAIDCFKRATDHLRQCTLTPSYQLEDWLGPTVVGVPPFTTVFHQCINNMAICALYTCRMPDAVNLMESLVREDPTAFLTERVAFNLCTMYELGCDSTASARKKRVLQLVAKRFFLHDVGPESFRIN